MQEMREKEGGLRKHSSTYTRRGLMFGSGPFQTAVAGIVPRVGTLLQFIGGWLGRALGCGPRQVRVGADSEAIAPHRLSHSFRGTPSTFSPYGRFQ